MTPETPNYESLRRQIRALATANPGIREFYLGSEAIQCYEAGLIASVSHRQVEDGPRVAALADTDVITLKYAPNLAPWAISLHAA